MKKIAFVIFLSVIFLNSCTRTVYNNFDEVILYYVDDYVTLDTEQEDILELELEKFIQEHKSISLPILIQSIHLIQTAIKESLTKEKIETIRKQLIVERVRFANAVIDKLVPLLVQLRTEQIDEVQANIKKRNQENQEKRKDRYENKTEEERVADALEDRIEDFEEWFDYITPQQEVYLKEYFNTNQWNYKIVLENRNHYTTLLVGYLKTEKDVKTIKLQLKQWIEKPELLTTQKYKEYQKRRLDARDVYIVKMVAMLEDEQIEYFVEQLEDYKENIQAILY